MQTIPCEKCIASFTDDLEKDLTPDTHEAVLAHLNECKDCQELFIAFEKISDLMHDASLEEVPKALSFDIKSIIKAGKKQKAKKQIRQWTSIAATFVICAGTLVAFNGEIKDMFQDKNSPSTEVGIASTMDSDPTNKETETLNDNLAIASQDCEGDELLLEYGISQRGFELFDQAMTDSIFASSVETMNLGYGYEVLDSFQEEDGSTTFVVYFYEDDTRTVTNLEDSADYLLLSNVRSFNWSKSEL